MVTAWLIFHLSYSPDMTSSDYHFFALYKILLMKGFQFLERPQKTL